MASPILLTHGGKTKQLLLYPGITSKEINDIIQSAFDLSVGIVGLEDSRLGIIFPLSLLSKDTSLFQASAPFTLLLRKNSTHSASPSSYAAQDDDTTSEQKRVRKRTQDYSQNYSHSLASLDSEDEGGELPIDHEHVLEYIQNNTAFSSLPLTDILQIFRSAAKSGLIDRITFEKCFADVMPPTDEQDAKIVKLVADRLFDIFDGDGNGYVDHAEFVAGLSLLCRASSDDKIKAAFSLFDIDGDGFITYDEMLRYMTSFFEVCFALDATMKKRFGNITAAQVGIATAKHCFERADINGDGRISYEEFTQWCNSDDSVARSGIIPQH